jgi:ubiquinone/menaquinone biosynthesis C-methylase UbiE
LWDGAASEDRPEHFVLRRDFLLAQVAAGERVLDLGCGLGDFVASLDRHGCTAVGCDVSEEALRRARARFPGLELVRSDEELPFGDGAFDVVWAGEVLEHVQDGLGLLGEVHRVLRARGRLIVTTPDHGRAKRLLAGLSARAFERAFDPRSDHVRFFTAGSLRATLAAADFSDTAIASRRGVLLATTTRV